MVHINAFLDKLRIAESKRSTQFGMSITEAKNLHTDITKLLLAMQALQETKAKEEVIQVEITSEDW